MKLLLDTHIWLWSHHAPDRLTHRVARALKSPANELWLSPLSVWEFLILVEKQRIRVRGEPDRWVRQALESAPLNEAPLTHEIAIESRKVALEHQDPADRFLVATAQVMGLVLITADERILRSRSVAVLANR